ncbi:uncharacterized protein LOC119986844 [Tripterygium wilfordii]|uniref:uncharacterized protein LOC119986844 n=1 Tax=Tripterygium wilfordii TaxID=458696 RepID=UPI0018F7FE73|nr:uncharacterized protein LOC119986844 [Tripterygium wilfordii]
MAASKFALLLLFVWCFSEFHIGVGVQNLSREEGIELKKQLKLLNKPAVTTIKTIYGEKYDCVDFYKQPAFDHPALTNHNFHPEMRPNQYPKGRIYEDSFTTHQPFINIWQNGQGCPTGTVPIKRITRDDFIKIQLVREIYAETYEPLTIQEPGTHYAILYTNRGTGKKFNGGGMGTTVYNPQPVTGSQYSSSQLKVANRGDSIEVGWTVNPSLYKDNRTRLFIYTRAGASRCFNTRCPGFVIVRTDLPLDMILEPYSRVGHNIYGKTLQIQRDPPNGNWWLQVGPNMTQVGFWPKNIFTGLADLATYIEWGAKAYSPPTIPSPPMGSGEPMITGDVTRDAFAKDITTINEASQIVDATETSTFEDIKEYEVLDEGITTEYRHLIYYGGEGTYVGK